jgi:hypothetical protein
MIESTITAATLNNAKPATTFNKALIMLKIPMDPVCANTTLNPCLSTYVRDPSAFATVSTTLNSDPLTSINDNY